MKEVQRLMELPRLIGEKARMVVALRAERRALEAEMDRLEAEAYLEAWGNRERERQARARLFLEEKEAYRQARHRLEQVLAALEKAQAEKEALEHERKALYGAILARHADLLEMAMAQRLMAPGGKGN